MRKSFLMGVVVFCGASLWAMVTFPSPATENGGCCQLVSQGKKPEKKDRALVCPIYKYADYGSYCSFYSEKCPKEWVSLDADCNIPLPGDCNTGNNCVLAWDVKKSLNTGKRAIHPNLKSGLKKKEKPVWDPISEKKTAFLIGKPIIAQIETTKTGKTCKAILYLILVDPSKDNKNGDAMIFSNGMEIEDPNTKIDIKISHKYVRFVGNPGEKYCYVDLGSVTYQVVLHEKTDVD